MTEASAHLESSKGARPGVLTGLGCFADGFRLLRRERALWPLAAAPLGVSLLAFALAAGLFLAAIDPVTAWLEPWLAGPTPGAWYTWLWVAPLRALTWIARWIVLGALGVLLYFAFNIVGAVLASPFLDALSRRVERIQTGGVVEVEGSGLLQAFSSAARIVWEEAKRAGFFLGVQGILFGLSFVPGLQPVTLALGLGFAVLFLPLDHAGYLLDRRGVPFRARRHWIWRHRAAVGGFGAGALLAYGLPLVNFVVLPWLVTGATLLALRLGPPSYRPNGGQGPPGRTARDSVRALGAR